MLVSVKMPHYSNLLVKILDNGNANTSMKSSRNLFVYVPGPDVIGLGFSSCYIINHSGELKIIHQVVIVHCVH